MNAETILARAEGKLGSKMPAGFKLKRNACLNLFRAQESYRLTEDSLLQGFLEAVSRNPEMYVELPKAQQTAEPVRSSVPHEAFRASAAPALPKGGAEVQRRIEIALAAHYRPVYRSSSLEADTRSGQRPMGKWLKVVIWMFLGALALGILAGLVLAVCHAR